MLSPDRSSGDNDDEVKSIYTPIRDLSEFSSTATGLAASVYEKIYTDASLHPEAYKGAYSMFVHLRPKPINPIIQSWLRRVYDLMDTGLVYKTYGLTLIDVLSMDSQQFEYLESRVRVLEKAYAPLQKGLETSLKKHVGDTLDV